MKSETVQKNILEVTRRLNSDEINVPGVRPLRLVLFGSAIKGKEKPNDIDLFLEYEDTDEVDHGQEILALMSYRKPNALMRFDIELRRGMKMVRIVPIKDGDYSNLVFDKEKEAHEILWERESGE